MNYGAIRSELAHRLETLEQLVAVHSTVPDRVVTPSAAVLPGDPFVTYHTTMSGTAGAMHRLDFDVIVFAGRFETTAGQAVIDELAGLIVETLEADQTLNNTASVVLVTAGTNYGVVTVADTTLTGCRFSVEVYTT